MRIKTLFFLPILLISFHLWADDTAITIFFTGDTRGYMLPFDYKGESAAGGMAARAALIDSLKSGDKNENLLVVDTGGIAGGTAESELYKGALELEAMKLIGYELSAVGFNDIIRSKSSFESLNGSADFYFVCSNLFTYDRNEKEIELSDSYYIKKFGLFKGVKVGFFGLISPDVLDYMSEEVRAEYSITDPVAKAKEMVKLLKEEEKVDLVICLSYLGYYENDNSRGSRQVAAEVEGIDLIIDGRTGAGLDTFEVVNGTSIFQTLDYGLSVGEIKLVLEGSEIKTLSFKRHGVNYTDGGSMELAGIAGDDAVNSAFARKTRNLSKLKDKRIVALAGDMSSKGVKEGETAISNLICDAMVNYFGVDAAFHNAGGIAEAEIKDKSDLNRNSFADILKYKNTIYLARVSGKELKELLTFSSARVGFGNFLQVGGISYSYNRSTQSVSEVKVGEAPLDEAKSYTIAFTSWLAGGGDGYNMLKNLTIKDDMGVQVGEAVYRYLSTFKKSYTPVVDGRIKMVE